MFINMKTIPVASVVFVILCQLSRYVGEGANLWYGASDPDLKLNVTQLITSKGYPADDHTAQTKDGFLLSLQRIPHGKNGRTFMGHKPVVFLLHGLLSSSADYVINFPEQSLGFVLADAGYDVWMGNTRGNTYSRHHVKYNPSQKEFWNFSFDEMAEYDLPAMIDYILHMTGQPHLTYIGHSQGTTAAFALLSESPEFNKKIKLYIALAPVANVGYVTSAIKFIAPFANDLNFLSKLLGMYELLPSNGLIQYLSHIACGSRARKICENIMFLLMGSDTVELNQTRLEVYTHHFPAGSSAKSLAHFGQLINSKTFRKFDYGAKKNMEHYNQKTPPAYNVTKITTPIVLFWAFNDALADPVDVEILRENLRSVVVDYRVPFAEFNHCDFVYAIDAPKLINAEVVKVLKKYTGIQGLMKSARNMYD